MNTNKASCWIKRQFKVVGMADISSTQAIVEMFQEIPGVQQVTADWQRNIVSLTYDLHQIQFQNVEKMLLKSGYPANTGLWQHWRRAWILFTEKNALDNLKNPGHCCNKPPSGK